jgi:hypothetical protein
VTDLLHWQPRGRRSGKGAGYRMAVRGADTEAARLAYERLACLLPKSVHSSSDFNAMGGRPACSMQAIRNNRVIPWEEP